MNSVEYRLIAAVYGDRKAQRSGVPLMNHIDEGLVLFGQFFKGLDMDMAKRAWCLHPLVQADDDLVSNFALLVQADPRAVALAMEYRRVANAYLSRRAITSLEEIELSPLNDVNKMLYVDKIQNRKDFRQYHLGTHPRSKELEQYFENWIQRLEHAMVV